MAHYDYEVEYYESEARQGNTYVDVYTSPSRKEVVADEFESSKGGAN